jgi:hypothetical protein
VAGGRLPVAKAEVQASVVTARTQEAFEWDQQVLLDEAARLSVDGQPADRPVVAAAGRPGRLRAGRPRLVTSRS